MLEIKEIRIALLALFLLAFFHTSKGQFLLGPAAGVSITDINVETIRLATDQQVNFLGGLEFTYLPHDNKPGIKLMAGRLSYGFSEWTGDRWISFTNTGTTLQFRNYLYIPIRTFRLSAEIGPGISLFDRPRVSPDQAGSQLPDFTQENVNRLMLDLMGGVGAAQKLGKFHLSVHSVFSFSVSKIFPEITGFNNPFSIQIWGGLQYEIFELRPKRLPRFLEEQ